jgi:AraC family transcriptional regulator
MLTEAPTLPVATVAARCGFATASHFVHAFRRARGTTPAVFRRGTGPAAR